MLTFTIVIFTSYNPVINIQPSKTRVQVNYIAELPSKTDIYVKYSDNNALIKNKYTSSHEIFVSLYVIITPLKVEYTVASSHIMVNKLNIY